MGYLEQEAIEDGFRAAHAYRCLFVVVVIVVVIVVYIVVVRIIVIVVIVRSAIGEDI